MKKFFLCLVIVFCVISMAGWFRPGGNIVVNTKDDDDLDEGTSFEVCESSLDIASAATISVYLSLGFNQMVRLDTSINLSGTGILQILEGPTATAATGTDGVAIINRNRSESAYGIEIYDNASTVNKVSTGVTITDNGTILRNMFLGASIEEDSPISYILTGSEGYIVLYSGRSGLSDAALILKMHEE